ncbi:universal stress protein [Bacillus sp. LL01]|uniref:universal stress protein n=1 Tax=Bacillus sp. LL01 TaxID=1665556 RepID=UPI00064D0E13|nr:universal stress protein [Bacillus sp. LL01]KMJ60126.1 universal stress protein [Bacillus sp. LL01]
MFQRILLASDGSDHSKRAAEKAIEIAKCNKDSILEIVYVIDGDQAKSDVLQNWNKADLDEKRKNKMQWVEARAKEAQISFGFKTLTGDPGPSIVKYANEQDFDLVVIGSRGLNTLQEFVLGSVSHKIAKRASCPVMIVK